MGHKTLSDKLDQIQTEDLGIHFDSTLLWEDLNAQIGVRKRSFDHRMLIAACITFLILFVPFILVNNSVLVTEFPPVSIVQEQQIVEKPVLSIGQEIATKKIKIHTIEKQTINSELAVAQVTMRTIQPMQVVLFEEQKRQLFANEDISIIQASLGTPSIRKGKSVAIRAQLQTSSQPVQLNNQAFKIKLFERSNQ